MERRGATNHLGKAIGAYRRLKSGVKSWQSTSVQRKIDPAWLEILENMCDE